MRRALFLAACLLAAAPAGAATWYVSPSGSNANDCKSPSTACRWPAKPAGLVVPGDTILVAPGTYRQTVSRADWLLITRDGTAAAPITIRGDGGRPVFDCSAVSHADGVNCVRLSASHWRIVGIDVTGARQAHDYSWTVGLVVDGSARALVDDQIVQVGSHDNQGVGIRLQGAVSNTRLLNSDSYLNGDPLTNYQDADGVDANPTGTGVVLDGVRAWGNADDGIDLYDKSGRAEPVTVTRSWSFGNGFVPRTAKPAGDGVGIKIGKGPARNVVTRNLAWGNRYTNYDSNQDGPNAPGCYQIDHDTSFKAGVQGFAMDDNPCITLDHDLSVSEDMSWIGGFPGPQTGNSWQSGGSPPGASDFQSLDPAGTDGPRQPDGSLPVLPFLRPVPGDRFAGTGAYAP